VKIARAKRAKAKTGTRPKAETRVETRDRSEDDYDRMTALLDEIAADSLDAGESSAEYRSRLRGLLSILQTHIEAAGGDT
jgi:hypothetical protein